MNFTDWFEQQHGKRPTMHGRSETDIRLMISEGENARDVLNAQLGWDARRESALYAWQAREKAKPVL